MKRPARLGVLLAGSLAVACAGAHGVIGGAATQTGAVIAAMAIIYGLAATVVSGAMLLAGVLSVERAR